MENEQERLIMTKEESAELWKGYVREQVTLHLEKFLSNAVSGNIGVKYKHPIRQMLETGPDFITNKANGVQLSLVFEFEDIIDLEADVFKEE